MAVDKDPAAIPYHPGARRTGTAVGLAVVTTLAMGGNALAQEATGLADTGDVVGGVTAASLEGAMGSANHHGSWGGQPPEEVTTATEVIVEATAPAAEPQVPAPMQTSGPAAGTSTSPSRPQGRPDWRPTSSSASGATENTSGGELAEDTPGSTGASAAAEALVVQISDTAVVVVGAASGTERPTHGRPVGRPGLEFVPVAVDQLESATNETSAVAYIAASSVSQPARPASEESPEVVYVPMPAGSTPQSQTVDSVDPVTETALITVDLGGGGTTQVVRSTNPNHQPHPARLSNPEAQASYSYTREAGVVPTASLPGAVLASPAFVSVLPELPAPVTLPEVPALDMPVFEGPALPDLPAPDVVEDEVESPAPFTPTSNANEPTLLVAEDQPRPELTAQDFVTAIGHPNVTLEFVTEVMAIAERLQSRPEYLLAAMDFETGGSFSASVPNAVGSGATGLIQFMPRTANGLGTSTYELAQMTPLEQLVFVEAYLAGASNSTGDLGTLEGVYTAIFRGRPEPNPATVLFTRSNGRAYSMNSGLDTNGDGRITSGEAANRVRQSAPWTAQLNLTI